MAFLTFNREHGTKTFQIISFEDNSVIMQIMFEQWKANRLIKAPWV